MRKVFNNDISENQFTDDGILKIKLLHDEDVSRLQNIYERFRPNTEAYRFHSTMFIKDAGYRQQISNEIQNLIGDKILGLFNNYKILFANFIVKEPGGNNRVDIHQDWSFTDDSRYTSVVLWLPLTDINEHTGLFFALKRSHTFLHNIRFTPYPEKAYEHLRKYVLEHSDVYHLKAGEAVIYHGALIHFSEPNISLKKRLAIGIVLIPSEAPNYHYYKRSAESKNLEVYEVNEAFYHNFDFYDEPKGARKVSEISEYAGLPLASELPSKKQS